jgi:hypothetical protein
MKIGINWLKGRSLFLRGRAKWTLKKRRNKSLIINIKVENQDLQLKKLAPQHFL